MPSLHEAFPDYNDYIESIKTRVVNYQEKITLNNNKDTIIPLISKRIGEYATNELQKIKNCLEQIYPNRFDMQVVLDPYFESIQSQGYGVRANYYVFNRILIDTVNVILHYPELTITNSSDQSMNIKDLFVKIEIPLVKTSHYTYNIRKIQGTKTTYTRREYAARYVHSHLQRFAPATRTDKGKDICDYMQFCTGSDTDINTNLALLNTESSIDENMFKLYLMQIDTMVKWESIEGVPHIHMKEAVERNYTIEDMVTESLELYHRNIMSKITRYHRVSDLTFTFDSLKKRYVIVDNEQFEDWFLNYDGGSISVKYHKDDSGKYYTRKDISDVEILPYHFQKYVVFNKQKYFFNIIEEPVVTETIELKKYIHPKIKNYVKSRLEYIANKEAAREGLTRRLSEDNYR